jgi:hypothetical protein
MDISLLIIVSIASLVLVPLTLLFIGGQFVRGNMDRSAATSPGASKLRSSLARDLEGLEDALIEFFARSKASSWILTVLAAHSEPIAFNALIKEIRSEQKRRRDGEDLPTSALRAVLSILQVVRLIHMNRDGFHLTELGREVYGRMTGRLWLRAAVRQHGRRDYSVAHVVLPLVP